MSDNHLPPNVIKVQTNGVWHRYVVYAEKLLNEEGHKSIEIRAFGKAITMAVKVSEQLRSTIVGLHQDIEVGSVEGKQTSTQIEGISD